VVRGANRGVLTTYKRDTRLVRAVAVRKTNV